MTVKRTPFLANGCYYIRYIPPNPDPEILFYEGTLRVLRLGAGEKLNPDGVLKAGGDLYCRRRDDPGFEARDSRQWGNGAVDQALVPYLAIDPPNIPIFPRQLYQYYLQVTDIEEMTITTLTEVPMRRVNLEFSVHEFSQDKEWPNPGRRTAWLSVLENANTNHNYPACKLNDGQALILAGDVLDGNSKPVGTLKMIWISNSLRRARVQIGTVKGVKPPGDDELWKRTFALAGWDVERADDTIIKDLSTASCQVSKGGESGSKAATEPDENSREWSVGALQQTLYVMRVREMVKYLKDEARKRKIDRLPLETMPLATIQAEIPELVTLPDPLDNEWIYHLLCVQRLKDTPRGLMFDTYGSDSRNLPREGAAVAAQWRFDDGALWGTAGNQKLEDVSVGTTDAYFRVAMHELGHAMGLDHNYQDEGFMNTTDSIANDGYDAIKSQISVNLIKGLAGQNPDFTTDAIRRVKPDPDAMRLGALVLFLQNTPDGGADTPTAPEAVKPEQARGVSTKRLIDPYALIGQEALQRVAAQATAASHAKLFPDNIRLQFQADDVNRLRFGPDVAIRPGTSYDSPGPLMPDEASAPPADGLQLEVVPLMASVPLGAPVRVNLRLKNTSGDAKDVPDSLSLKTGMVEGRVTDPQGEERTFWPLKRHEDNDTLATLPPCETKTSGLTLLRGAQSALFPTPGDHQIKVKATWERNGASVFVEGEATVHIAEAVDAEHRSAARIVLSTPDTLLSLAIIGDQFSDGNAAIQVAIANPVLKPHFDIVEAKRLMIGALKPSALDAQRKKDACALIQETSVMSFDEIEKMCEMLEISYENAKTEVEGVHKVLGKKVLRMYFNDEMEPARLNELLTKYPELKTHWPPGLSDGLQAHVTNRSRTRGRMKGQRS